MPFLTIFRSGLVSGLLLTTPGLATADSLQEIVRTLAAEGFEVNSVESTLLGRIRIEAINETYLREVVLSKSTGEIKQDAVFVRRLAEMTSAGPATRILPQEELVTDDTE